MTPLVKDKARPTVVLFVILRFGGYQVGLKQDTLGPSFLPFSFPHYFSFYFRRWKRSWKLAEQGKFEKGPPKPFRISSIKRPLFQ